MNLQSIGDRALPRIEIIRCVLRRLGDPHFVPQRVDCGIRSVEIVFVMFRLKFAQEQRYSDHVLQAVVTVGRVRQRPDLRNDANGRLVCCDIDSLDLVQEILDPRVQRDRRFNCSLSVKLGRERNLEEYVLHDVTTETAAEGK